MFIRCFKCLKKRLNRQNRLEHCRDKAFKLYLDRSEKLKGLAMQSRHTGTLFIRGTTIDYETDKDFGTGVANRRKNLEHSSNKYFKLQKRVEDGK